MFGRLHKNKITTLIASMLLGLFLFTNFGVNFTELHQHENHFAKENSKSNFSHPDCYICDFQGLFYDNPTPNDFQILQHNIETRLSILYHPVSLYFTEYYNAIQQRGPPTLWA